MPKTFLLVLAATAALRAQAQLPAPGDLRVVKATRSTVDLVWTANAPAATSYLVERRTLTGDYSVPLTSKEAKASDVSFDLNETYVYRVRAADAQTVSGPSNEVTVGPPPIGYNLLLAAPSGADPSRYYAVLQMTPDPNTDPAFSYVIVDPDSDGDPSDSTLHFLSWNRAQHRWNDPVPVAAVGPIVPADWTIRPVSLALDPSTKQWAIAHETNLNGVTRIDVHFSDDGGLTWKQQTIARDPEVGIGAPSVVLAGGTAHLAWHRYGDGIRYAAVVLAEDAAPPTSIVVPPLAGEESKVRSFNLARDGNNLPALAFISTPRDGYNLQVGFWRPGSDPVRVTDSNNFQDDTPYARLTFYGLLPSIVFAMRRDDRFYADYDHALWFVNSTDAGASWKTPVNVKADGLRSLNPPADLAFGSRGQAAIVSDTRGGTGEGVCNQPRLSRSEDLSAWQMCGIAALGQPDTESSYPSLYFATNDKLYIAFQNHTPTPNTLPVGLVLWREP